MPLRDACVALSILCTIGATSMYAKTFVYVSNAQDGNIDAYSMDQATGALTSMGKTDAGKVVMPMALSADKKFLYAVVRSDPFKVMPYVSTDRTGRFLFTASYGGDKAAVSPIGADGLVEGPATQVIPTGRNAHAILIDRTNRFVFVPNLGSDEVLEFLFDAKTGRLTANDPPLIKTHGPRHLAFSPDNKYLYVLSELDGHVTQFALDQTKGTLMEVDKVGSVPPEAGLVPGVPQAPVGAAPPPASAADDKPKIWAADLAIVPSGKFLYSTERTTSKIALFSVASGTGKLTYVTNFATEKQPRGIRIDPTGTYLVASGEKSDRLSVYRIDQDGGKLTEIGRYPVGNGANWVEIVEFP